MSENSSFEDFTQARSEYERSALTLVMSLQNRLLEGLQGLTGDEFTAIDWARDQGRHGGGRRYSVAETSSLNRGSINVSYVHYHDLPEKRLRSATALSTIIHPHNPFAPSLHLHISWTELRRDKSYWRLMADLNPSHPDPEATRDFEAALRDVAPSLFEEAKLNGERYFLIPALGRHRGVAHYYLENYATNDFDADRALAQALGEAVIDRYLEIFKQAQKQHQQPDEEAIRRQRAYHSLYLLQVLTLDRGTTAGLLVHDQNDLGILASLPSFVNRELLASWVTEMETPQDELLQAIVDTLPAEDPSPVTDQARSALASVLRNHYQAHPEALAMQARGDIIPKTVQNHLD